MDKKEKNILVEKMDFCEKMCLPNKPNEWKCSYHLGSPACKEVELFAESFLKV